MVLDLPLRNLVAQDAAALLHGRGVRGEPLIEDLVRWAYGHPLASVIAAEQALATTPRQDGTAGSGVLFAHPCWTCRSARPSGSA